MYRCNVVRGIPESLEARLIEIPFVRISARVASRIAVEYFRRSLPPHFGFGFRAIIHDYKQVDVRLSH